MIDQCIRYAAEPKTTREEGRIRFHVLDCFGSGGENFVDLISANSGRKVSRKESLVLLVGNVRCPNCDSITQGVDNTLDVSFEKPLASLENIPFVDRMMVVETTGGVAITSFPFRHRSSRRVAQSYGTASNRIMSTASNKRAADSLRGHTLIVHRELMPWDVK